MIQKVYLFSNAQQRKCCICTAEYIQFGGLKCGTYNTYNGLNGPRTVQSMCRCFESVLCSSAV